MNKETILWMLIGATITQSFVNEYLGYPSWMLFAGLSAFFLGVLCITPKKILEETLFNEVKNEKRKKVVFN